MADATSGTERPLADEALSLKEQKELFVSGLQGTSPIDLVLVCSAATVSGTLFFYAVLSLYPNHDATIKPQWHRQPILILLEGVAFWVPTVLCQTVWMYPHGVTYMLLQILISMFVKFRRTKSSVAKDTKSPDTASNESSNLQLQQQQEQQQQQLIITIYRSILMLLTMTAILAVDFHVFPRRHAKTETFGYSLMDLGAASFVVAAGIVSPRARQRQQRTPKTRLVSLESKHSWNKTMRRMMPLLFMGSLRLLTHKGIEYQEHASEYGVHWNFFFTLAFLPVVATMLSFWSGSGTRQQKPSLVAPLFILTLYQAALTLTGLQEWVEEAPRSCPRRTSTITIQHGHHHTSHSSLQYAIVLCEFWCANREGILGCLSYASLYLVSEWIAFACFWSDNTAPQTMHHVPTGLGFHSGNLPRPPPRLWIAVVTLLGLWRLGTSTLGIAVSRRTTNVTFGLWVLLINMLQLAGIQWAVRAHWTSAPRNTGGGVATSTHGVGSSLHAQTTPAPPLILATINRHGLVMFIIANLLTGAVNLSMNTLQVSNASAVGILAAYLGLVGLIATAIDQVWKRRESFLVRYRRRERPASQGGREKTE